MYKIKKLFRNTKRYMAILLALAVLLPVVPNFVFAADPESVVDVSVDFQDDDLDATSGDSWLHTSIAGVKSADGTVKVVADPVEPESANKVLKATGPTAGASVFFEEQSDIITAEFKILFDSYSIYTVRFRKGLEANTMQAISFIARASGSLEFNNGSTAVKFITGEGDDKYELNKWYEVKIDADIASGEYDIYFEGVKINGETKAKVAGGSGGVKITSLDTLALNSTGSTVGSVYLDDVHIYVDGVIMPRASVPGGIYASSREVELSTPTKDAAIYYTLDGTEPTADSTEYTGVILVSEDTTIKAITIKEGTISPVMTEVYSIIEGSDPTPVSFFDFESDTISELPPYPWSDASSLKGVVTVQPDPDDSANNALFIEDTSNVENSIAELRMIEQTESFSVKFRVRYEALDVYTIVLKQGGGNTALGVSLVARKTGKLSVYNGGTETQLMDYEIGTWYDVEIDVDVLNQKFDLSINGDEKIAGASFRNAGITAIDRITFGTTGGTIGDMYIDDIEAPEAPERVIVPVYTPEYKEYQVLYDPEADESLAKPGQNYTSFPSIIRIDDEHIFITYKHGFAHMNDDGDVEGMIYNTVTETVISRFTIDDEATENAQNPEVLRMPNGDLVIYCDIQRTTSSGRQRLKVKEYRSTDNGYTWNLVRESLKDNTGIEYGYTFDDVIIGDRIYMLAMSFPEFDNEQASPGRSVHMIYSDDNGETWTHLKNLKEEFGYSFNESTFLPYEDGFVVFTRGDESPPTRIYKTDINMNVIQSQILSENVDVITSSGRPKLFLKDGDYYVLMRGYPFGTGNMNLVLHKMNMETLLPESCVILDGTAGDGFYAEHYYQIKDGVEYFNAITYTANYAAGTKPDIVRLEYIWDELKNLTPVERVAAPVASIPSGSFTESQTVELSTETEGATIYYTTDGSTPDAGSTKYESPIAVNESMTIKAIAIKSGMIKSAVVSFDYVIDTEPEPEIPVDGVLYDFEDETIGKMPGYPWQEFGNISGAISVVADSTDSENKALLIEDDSSTLNTIAGIAFNDQTETFKASFKVKYADYDVYTITLRQGQSDESVGVSFVARANKKLSVYNGSSEILLMDYETGRWYDVEIIVDVVANKFSVLIDGEEKISDAGFRFAGRTAINYMTFGTISSTIGSLFIDDVFVPVSPEAPDIYYPDYKEAQVLYDADADPDLLKPGQTYTSFPSILELDNDELLIVYKHGFAHANDDGDMEAIIFDKASKTVLSRFVIDDDSMENAQNPEVLRMPNGDLVIYCDIQSSTPPLKRLKVKEYRSEDNGRTWTVVRESLKDNTGIEYGYTFDDVIIGDRIYMLAMSFPEFNNEQASPGRSVHMIYSDDNGETWIHVKNLNEEFGYSFNESTFEPYEDGFVVITRGDANSTRIYITDMEFNMLRSNILTDNSPMINASGRPKLFIKDGDYYVLMRGWPYSEAMQLVLHKLDLETLLPENVISLDDRSGDAFYAEHYFHVEDGVEYFNAITYTGRYTQSNPDIVHLEFIWDELKNLEPVERVAMTVATIPSGSYTEPQTVELSTETEGAEIYYTTDGSTPDAGGTKYESPIAVNESMTIKAIAIKDGMIKSAVVSFDYVIDTDPKPEIPVDGVLYDFEDETIGKMPGYPWYETSSILGVVSVKADPDDSNNKVLYIKDDSGNANSIASIVFEDQTDAFTAKFRVRYSTHDIYTINLKQGTDNTGLGMSLVARANGKLSVYNGSAEVTFMDYETDTWYDVEANVDVANRKFSLAINGETKITDATFRSAGTTIINNLTLGTTGVSIGDLYVDDVIVPQSPEEPPTVEIYAPVYKELQILYDADEDTELLKPGQNYTSFPTILELDNDELLIIYKHGFAHANDDGDMDAIIYDRASKIVISRFVLDDDATENTQNPEVLRMPNGDLVIYCDIQRTTSSGRQRLKVKEYRSTDNGRTWTVVRESLKDNTGIEYGYTFDDVIIGDRIYMLAMSFPEFNNEQASPGRSVHMIYSDDSGETWTHLKNLSEEFGYAFNESTFEPYEDGFAVFTRGDSQSTRIYVTDMDMNVLRSRILTGNVQTITSSGRPKMFIKDGEYYVLMRGVPVGGPMNLVLHRFDMETLFPENCIILDVLETGAGKANDGYYAEQYFEMRDGQEYLNVITYSGSYSAKPDIVRLEYLWDEIREMRPVDTNPPVWEEDSLSVEKISDTQAELKWVAARDDYGVKSYEVYRNDESIGKIDFCDVEETIFTLPGVKTNYAGQGQVYLVMPENVPEGVKLPMVIGIHGSGGNALVFRDHDMYSKEKDLALKYGYIFVALSNGQDAWGTDDGLYNLNLLHEYMTENYNVDEKAVLYAYSAGGTLAYRMIKDYPEKVDFMVGTYPVYDLTSFTGASAQAAWGASSYEEYVEAVADVNPSNYPEAYKNHRIYLSHGSEDAAVPVESNSLKLQNDVTALGGYVELQIVEGKGHDSSVLEYYTETANNAFIENPAEYAMVVENISSEEEHSFKVVASDGQNTAESNTVVIEAVPGGEDPEDPEEPEEPEDPEEPEEPEDPEEPEEPEDPEDPEDPKDPEDPEDPEDPVVVEQISEDTYRVEFDDEGATTPVKVTIPVEGLKEGFVAVIVHPDGREEIIQKSSIDGDNMTLMLSGSATIKIVDNSRQFTDISQDEWYTGSVRFVSARDLMKGTSETEFNPDYLTNRAMIVTILHRLENSNLSPQKIIFDDVQEDTWYTDAVAWAIENEIASGYGNNKFGPEDSVSREQLAVFLYRYMKVVGIDTDESGDLNAFTDNNEISSWAQEAMEWAVGSGIIQGKGNGVLDPGGLATRAEVAAMIQRVIEYMLK